MSMVSSNRLLPLFASLVLVLTVFVAVKSCSPGNDAWQELGAVPQAPRPDADTPADTIKTLTANVSAMTTEVKALRQENAGLKQDNQALIQDRSQIEKTVLSRVSRPCRRKIQDTETQRQASAQRDASPHRRIDRTRRHTVPVPVGSSLVPHQCRERIGYPCGAGVGRIGSARRRRRCPGLGAAAGADRDTAGLRTARWSSAWVAQRTMRWTAPNPQGERLVERGAKALNSATPVYTIPRNATLIGSIAMTALVGRVPVKGQVRDPMPFKVIAGKDNLAANGLTIPNVQGMVFSGTAIGDWTLSCVTGQLESVTFVFEDGTIQTVSSDDNSLAVVPVETGTSRWVGSPMPGAFPVSPASVKPTPRLT